MQIDIITLFPEIFSSIFSASIIKRATQKNLVSIDIVNLRNFGLGKHKQVDDKPYGGGVGMILRVDVLEQAITFVKKRGEAKHQYVILLDPTGKQFTQNIARRLSRVNHLIFVCGHYEGVDKRVQKFVDERISIGPYILTGGEMAAAVLTETVVRLLPGVIPKPEATKEESFGKKFKLEYPQYTRPSMYKGLSVPKILLSGNHPKIQEWRRRKSSL